MQLCVGVARLQEKDSLKTTQDTPIALKKENTALNFKNLQQKLLSNCISFSKSNL